MEVSSCHTRSSSAIRDQPEYLWYLSAKASPLPSDGRSRAEKVIRVLEYLAETLRDYDRKPYPALVDVFLHEWIRSQSAGIRRFPEFHIFHERHVRGRRASSPIVGAGPTRPVRISSGECHHRGPLAAFTPATGHFRCYALYPSAGELKAFEDGRSLWSILHRCDGHLTVRQIISKCRKPLRDEARELLNEPLASDLIVLR